MIASSIKIIKNASNKPNNNPPISLNCFITGNFENASENICIKNNINVLNRYNNIWYYYR